MATGPLRFCAKCLDWVTADEEVPHTCILKLETVTEITELEKPKIPENKNEIDNITKIDNIVQVDIDIKPVQIEKKKMKVMK